MKIIVTISTDNDAFEPHPGPEVSRILHRAALAIEPATGAPRISLLTGNRLALIDRNGNKVGAIDVLD